MPDFLPNLLPLPSLLIIPTGIGCSVGGYAGDAIPSARLLAASSGCLITHPNVMNGGSLYWSDRRIHYVEGYSIDRFASGDLILKTVREQKVGLLIDAGLDKDILQRHLQVADGCRASLGINIGPFVITDEPLEISLNKGTSGSSWGIVENLDSLLRAGIKLKEEGATAIAVVTRFPDDYDSNDLNMYRKGRGVDQLAGAEAVISHLLVKQLNIPCAHAPALSLAPIEFDLDPRAAGEEVGYTFLTSVLVGLSRAPDLVSIKEGTRSNPIYQGDYIRIDQVGAAIVPEDALGGAAVLACLEKRIPLICVANKTVLDVNCKSLGLSGSSNLAKSSDVYNVSNYIEAAGLILALREGIAIPSLKRPIDKTYQI